MDYQSVFSKKLNFPFYYLMFCDFLKYIYKENNIKKNMQCCHHVFKNQNFRYGKSLDLFITGISGFS